jgi:hypothetical protein
MNETVEVYHVPGCSSCLRMKEFVEKSGIPFEDISLAVSPERGAKLQRLGVYPPAVVVGDRAVPGLDLVGIANLLGINYNPPLILAPAALKAKYDVISNILCASIPQIPADQLRYRTPDRDRSLRSLAAHAGTIMRKFLEAYDSDVFDLDVNDCPPPPELAMAGTTGELLDWATGTKVMFRAWWERFGYDDAFDRVCDTTWGYRTLQEVFERAVWHTAHHTRQITYFLTEFGIEPTAKLTEDDLAGLPVPHRVLS